MLDMLLLAGGHWQCRCFRYGSSIFRPRQLGNHASWRAQLLPQQDWYTHDRLQPFEMDLVQACMLWEIHSLIYKLPCLCCAASGSQPAICQKFTVCSMHSYKTQARAYACHHLSPRPECCPPSQGICILLRITLSPSWGFRPVLIIAVCTVPVCA